MQPTQFQITGVKTTKSNYTHKDVYAVFFKGDDGKAYKSWIDPGNGNFKRWSGLLVKGNVLKGLRIKGGTLIDADSFPVLVQQ